MVNSSGAGGGVSGNGDGNGADIDSSGGGMGVDNAGGSGSGPQHPSAAPSSDLMEDVESDSSGLIALHVTPTTGGNFTVLVEGDKTVLHLKKIISKNLKVTKERFSLLHRERELHDGTLMENGLVDGSKLVLTPNVETGLLTQRAENTVMQALESLNDKQVNDFLSGRSPLNLSVRLGEHMMLIQLQLSTLNPSSSQTATIGSGGMSFSGGGRLKASTSATKAVIVKPYPKHHHYYRTPEGASSSSGNVSSSSSSSASSYTPLSSYSSGSASSSKARNQSSPDSSPVSNSKASNLARRSVAKSQSPSTGSEDEMEQPALKRAARQESAKETALRSNTVSSSSTSIISNKNNVKNNSTLAKNNNNQSTGESNNSNRTDSISSNSAGGNVSIKQFLGDQQQVSVKMEQTGEDQPRENGKADVERMETDKSESVAGPGTNNMAAPVAISSPIKSLSKLVSARMTTDDETVEKEGTKVTAEQLEDMPEVGGSMSAPAIEDCSDAISANLTSCLCRRLDTDAGTVAGKKAKAVSSPKVINVPSVGKKSRKPVARYIGEREDFMDGTTSSLATNRVDGEDWQQNPPLLSVCLQQAEQDTSFDEEENPEDPVAKNIGEWEDFMQENSGAASKPSLTANRVDGRQQKTPLPAHRLLQTEQDTAFDDEENPEEPIAKYIGEWEDFMEGNSGAGSTTSSLSAKRAGGTRRDPNTPLSVHRLLQAEQDAFANDGKKSRKPVARYIGEREDFMEETSEAASTASSLGEKRADTEGRQQNTPLLAQRLQQDGQDNSFDNGPRFIELVATGEQALLSQRIARAGLTYIAEPPNPPLKNPALAEASRNLTQTLRKLSKRVFTSSAATSAPSSGSSASVATSPTASVPSSPAQSSGGSSLSSSASSSSLSSLASSSSSAPSSPVPAPSSGRNVSSGAVIESMKHHGKGIYSGTFSGTLNPALQDQYGRPKRDISTIIHILNDLLSAAPQCTASETAAGRAGNASTSSSAGGTGNNAPSESESASDCGSSPSLRHSCQQHKQSNRPTAGRPADHGSGTSWFVPAPKESKNVSVLAAPKTSKKACAGCKGPSTGSSSGYRSLLLSSVDDSASASTATTKGKHQPVCSCGKIGGSSASLSFEVQLQCKACLTKAAEEENQKMKLKIDSLRLIMKQKRERREARKQQTAPYNGGMVAKADMEEAVNAHASDQVQNGKFFTNTRLVGKQQSHALDVEKETKSSKPKMTKPPQRDLTSTAAEQRAPTEHQDVLPIDSCAADGDVPFSRPAGTRVRNPSSAKAFTPIPANTTYSASSEASSNDEAASHIDDDIDS
ncbi:midnolin homolog isoform X2 [Anopheles coustani]|uniref:midnolin homolog isoform X2 n=1 Tax=Anopheles coustani TaxID=139045 RepID=UPI002659FA6A|nr:midnolin homolog isoform X2 [Anopheles coustani]